MRRALVIALVLGLVSIANAQVFKPKGKKADAVEKKPEKKAVKKTTKAPKKKTGAKSKKAAAADREDSSDSGSKAEDFDFVKITDDDEIE